MQPGFFDLENRHQQLEKLGDPLPKLSALVDWEGFRPLLNRIREKERKSAVGRKPYDVVLMFKVLFLQGFFTDWATNKPNTKSATATHSAVFSI